MVDSARKVLSRRLTLGEVREAAVPAVFRAFGDHLLYMEGKVYGLPADPLSGDLRSHLALPETYVVHETVGIEYGWEHLEGCRCGLCRQDAA